MINYLLKIINETLQSGLFVHEVIHGVVGIPLAYLIYKKSKTAKFVILYFFVVYFLDLDHFVDYWLFSGINFDILRFVSLDYFKIIGQAIIPFHGWEYALLFAFLGQKKKWKSPFSVISLAMVTHLVWDALSLNSFSFYSIIYRMTTGFILPQ